jgi:PadR family transcriptional regulator AphA
MAVANSHRGPHRSGAGSRGLSLAEWLLLCLVREQPAHGHALAELLDRSGSLGQIWSVARGVVYRDLQRLEFLGLIRTAGEQQPSLGPARWVLETTPEGQTAARAWLRAPVEHARDVRSELLVKLALLDRAGSDSQALVEAQIARLVPLATALGEQLRAATGFERTLLLWRHKSLTATMRFLEDLAAGHSPLPSPG